MGGSADGGRNTAHDKAANLSVAPPARPYFNGMSTVATKIIAVSCMRVPTPGYGCAATQALYDREEGKKSDAPELHKVACRFAMRLPEGHCRVAATPYPAYKTKNQTTPVGPCKRSAAGHCRTELPLTHHRQKPPHRPRTLKPTPAERDIGIKFR